MIKPVILGLLWGVYEKVLVGTADCYWTEYKLISLHLNKQNAENSVK